MNAGEELEVIRKTYKISIIPFVTNSLICLGPIINFWMNIHNKKIQFRLIFLIIGIMLLILNWLLYYRLYQSSKKDMKETEQFIINNEFNKN